MFFEVIFLFFYSSFPRAAWECGAGRAASRIRKTLFVTRGAARLDCIPTQRVGTRAFLPV